MANLTESGPQGTAGGGPLIVDGSAVTQPISAVALPLPSGTSTETTLQRTADALNEIALNSILSTERLVLGL